MDMIYCKALLIMLTNMPQNIMFKTYVNMSLGDKVQKFLQLEYWRGYMSVRIRSWKMEDAESLARALNNKKVQDNLRDGLPFPYTAAFEIVGE